MKDMKQEMITYTKHDYHIIYYKSQMHKLLTGFCEINVIIKTDFIQNITHNKRQEMTQLYHDKRQS
jgi:hypothetical protein